MNEAANSGCRPGDCLELPLRQKVFASLLGTSRETLNKQLHASDGLIRITGGSIIIEQPKKLAEIAEG